MSTAVEERAEQTEPGKGHSDADPPQKTGRFAYQWVALGIVLIGSIMSLLDITIVNIAVSTLQHDFKVSSYSDIAWIVTGYSLAQAAVIPAAGWATDRFGTKQLYIASIVLFTVASAACGLSQNLGQLIFFRVLQGMGGGMIMPIGMTIIMRVVGPSRMGKVMAFFGVPMMLAPALGPVIGAFLVKISWQYIFFVNIPIGVIGVVLAWRFLKETPKQHKLKLDWLGLITVTPALLALMYGFDRSTSLGFSSPLVISMFVLSAFLMMVFIRHQTRTDEPLLPLRLFKDGTFSAAMAISFALITAMFGAMFLLPIYFQQIAVDSAGHHYDVIGTALLLMPQAFTAAVFMPIGGVLTDKIGPKPVVITGLIILTVSGIMLAQLAPTSSVMFIEIALILRGASMAFVMMPSMAGAMARVPKEFMSRASSITNAWQRGTSAVGVALLVSVLAAQIAPAGIAVSCSPSTQVLASVPAHFVSGQMGNSAPVTTGALCSAMQSLIGKGFSDPAQQQRLASQVSGNHEFDIFAQTYFGNVVSGAFDRTFVFIAIVAALGMIPALFLRKPEGHLSPGMMAG